MKAIGKLRRTRRSGISNLIGAIFFILIVALSLAILTVMFTVSTGYIGGIHTTNLQAVQAVNSNVTVSDVAFGGQLATTRGSFAVEASPPSTPLPLLPITNMNFSSGIQGWSVSKSYPALVDSATVSNGLQSNGSAYIEQTKLPLINPVTFVLTVTNNAPLGSGDFIDKISVLVDTYFTSVAGGSCILGCAGWSPQPIVADAGGYFNNLTLTAPPAAGVPPTFTATWEWSADVPQAAASYYHTVVVYWSHNGALAYFDYGIATVATTVTSPLPLPNPPAPMMVLNPRTAGISPGGLIAGYDSNAIMTTSSSGPGSIYVNFEPNFNGQALPSGQQLSAGAAFTTAFYLTQAEICQLSVTSPPNCSQTATAPQTMAASISSSLDEVASVPNALIYYHIVLVNPSGTAYTFNQGGTDPTTLNHFGPSGWQEQSVQATPQPNFWVPGAYKFELVVNMTMTSGQPSELSMHFSDIGLALNLVTPVFGGSAYGSGTLTMTFPGLTALGLHEAGYNQVEVLNLGVNMSLSSDPAQTLIDTAGYVYAAETPVGVLNEPTVTTWYEVGTVTFNGSATANVVIPAPKAASLVDSTGQLTIEVVAISVGGGTPCPALPGPQSCTLSVSAYAVAQTENTAQATGQAVFTITEGEGASPIHLVSLYISGPNGTLPANPAIGSTNGVARFTIDNWVNTGSTVVICDVFGPAATPSASCPAASPPANFEWIPGQVYQVSVVSVQGTIYSASFTAP